MTTTVDGRGRSGRGGRGRGGRGRGRAYQGFFRSLRQGTTPFSTVGVAAATSGVSVVEGAADQHKTDLSKKCTLRFHGSVSQADTDTWYQRYREVWPCPTGGFKGATVAVFWDIENCRPDPDYAPLPLNYAIMLREAFKSSTDAQSMTCVASLSATYPATVPGVAPRPGDSKLNYTQLSTLNASSGYMFVLPVPGKSNQTVHKDVREADDTLKAKMDYFLQESKPGDVAVIISGDGGYQRFCMDAKHKGVNVVVMGPGLANTKAELMVAADMWMDWATFARYHGKQQRRVPTTMSPKVKERTEKLLATHAEQYSCIKQLDFVLLMDVTGSMQAHIEAAKNNIHAMLDQVAVRFPWAKQHMRIGFIGYRDFMHDTESKVEKEPFVWDGGPANPPSLGAPDAAAGSADRLRDLLKGVRATGGADAAEDVLGGLLKVADMLAHDGRGRNCVLFHVCDAPQHGSDFNDYGPKHDSYLDGPQRPTGGAVAPPGRTMPWKEEAKEVLQKLKSQLNVVKYAIMQLTPKATSKMVRAFRQIVGDPTDDAPDAKWSPKMAVKEEGDSKSNGQLQDQEAWIVALEAGDMSNAAAISNNLVRMMVSTTLASITQLSQLVYDKKTGMVAKDKKRDKGRSVALATLAEMDEDAELGLDADTATHFLNKDAVDLSRGEADDDEAASKSGSSAGSPQLRGSQSGAPQATSTSSLLRSTNYRPSELDRKKNTIMRRIKQKLTPAIQAEEVSLMEPPSILELVENIKDGERAQRAGKEPPQLLHPMASSDTVFYYKAAHVMAEGAHRMVYDAIREVKKGPGMVDQSLVVMKEYSKSYAHGNSMFKYYQMSQGNVVANFLASIFNNECAEMGIAQVHGRDRMDLVYMSMWTASWDVPRKDGSKGRCNHHVEPYILGKYIKYNSNDGGINGATSNDICHAFSHWTYHATEGMLLVSDVQGVKDHYGRKVLLTDPAIHCAALVDNYFDPDGNRGPVGMKEFFLSHCCNEACKALGLKPAEQELSELRAAALAGKLPGRCGVPLDLDEGL